MAQEYSSMDSIDEDWVCIDEPPTSPQWQSTLQSHASHMSTSPCKSQNTFSLIASSPSPNTTPWPSSPPSSMSPSPVKRGTYSDISATDISPSTMHTYPPPMIAVSNNGYEAAHHSKRNDAAYGGLLKLASRAIVKHHPLSSHNPPPALSAPDSLAPPYIAKPIKQYSNFANNTSSTPSAQEDSIRESAPPFVPATSNAGWNIEAWASSRATQASTCVQKREPILVPTEIYFGSEFGIRNTSLVDAGEQTETEYVL